MSVTVAAATKKIAVYLATDKRTWKVVGTIIGIAIAIVLLPVMLLLAMGNQLSSAETQSIDFLPTCRISLPSSSRSFLRWNRTEQLLRMH